MANVKKIIFYGNPNPAKPDIIILLFSLCKAFSDVGPFVMRWELNKFPFTQNIIPFGWVE